MRAALCAAAALLIAGAGAGTAQAATPALHCQASTLSASGIGFPQPVSPITAGGTGPCADASVAPALPSNPLVSASLLASTSYDAATKTGSAVGGLLSLKVVPTPDLIAQMPTEQAIAALKPVSETLNLPLGVLGAIIPVTYSLDVSKAVQALVTPPTSLLSADVVRAHATVSCASGAPTFSGSHELAGVTAGGVALPADGVLQQAITLIGAQHIPLGTLDLNDVVVKSVTSPLTGLPLIGTQLSDALNALASNWSTFTDAIDLPATTLDVAIAPGQETRTARSLTERALTAAIDLGGIHVLDAAIGEATVSADDGACAAPAAPPEQPAPAAPPVDQGGVAGVVANGTVTDQILACSDRKLVLVDVLRRGRRVKLLGAANRDYAGRRVAIRLQATHRVVAHATVRKDGSFATTAPLPPRRFRTPARRNRVRYTAEIGRERSRSLKLHRRMIVTRMSSAGGKVTIAGRVVGPLTHPATTITVTRRLSCAKVAVVKRFRPRANGRFSVTVPAPPNQIAAVYRMTTFVRANRHNAKRFPTFTLPRGVALDTR